MKSRKTPQSTAHPPSDFGHEFHRPKSSDVARRRLVTVMWLNVFMMFAEIFGGLWTNSLALLADASHMLTHLFALGVSYIAIRLSERAIDTQRTWGYQRAEPIGAMINGITLLLIVVVITVEAVRKIISPQEIQVQEMLAVAVAGLVVNLLSAYILKDSAHDDLNIRGSFVHLLTDTISSIAIVVGGLIVAATGWWVVDPILSVVIAVVIGVWGWRLLRDAGHILLESAPPDIDTQKLARRIGQVEAVRAVHDVHIWQISSGSSALTAHILVDDLRVSETTAIRDRINTVLSSEFQIGHSNLQFELYGGSV